MTRLPEKIPTVELRDRPAWLRGVVLALPGVIFENEGTGERLRLLPDGTLEPLYAPGRPGGTSAHSTAIARRP